MPDAVAGSTNGAIAQQELVTVTQAVACEALAELPPGLGFAFEESDEQLRLKRSVFCLLLAECWLLSTISARLQAIEPSAALHSPPPELLG